MVDRAELEAARERVQGYRCCGHPLVPTAIWLLGALDRLLAERERAAEPRVTQEWISKTDILELLDRRCRARPGAMPTYDLDLHRRASEAIFALREQLAERTLQHRIQLDNAVRLLRENEIPLGTIQSQLPESGGGDTEAA